MTRDMIDSRSNIQDHACGTRHGSEITGIAQAMQHLKCSLEQCPVSATGLEEESSCKDHRLCNAVMSVTGGVGRRRTG